LVTHALPRIAASSQYVAFALQNRICPAVAAVDPAATEAVNVTTAPGDAFEGDTPRVVKVADCACAYATASITTAKLRIVRTVRRSLENFIDSLSWIKFCVRGKAALTLSL
jgi:hypothetical protein